MRACLVQGSQQIWVAALWYWGNSLDGVKQNNMAPWWIVLIVWPLSVMSFAFVYLLLYGLPGKHAAFYLRSTHRETDTSTDYYRQTPPKVPNFLKTLFRRKLVLW